MTEPLTVTEVANYLRLDTDQSPLPEQELLTNLIFAARLRAEEFLGCNIVTRESIDRWEEFLNFTSLSRAPWAQGATDVVITYLDADDVEQTVSALVYGVRVTKQRPKIYLKQNQEWPEISSRVPYPIVVTYTAGYPTGEVPAPIRVAMLLIIGDLYANREGGYQGGTSHTYQINPNVKALLTPYRTLQGMV